MDLAPGASGQRIPFNEEVIDFGDNFNPMTGDFVGEDFAVRILGRLVGSIVQKVPDL